MKEEEFGERFAEIIQQEQSDGQFGWWYLSFVSEQDGWLGGCFVQGFGIVSAAATASLMGCNPGGEVAGWGPLPKPRPGYENRLLTKDEIDLSDPQGTMN